MLYINILRPWHLSVRFVAGLRDRNLVAEACPLLGSWAVSFGLEASGFDGAGPASKTSTAWSTLAHVQFPSTTLRKAPTLQDTSVRRMS